MAQKEFTPDTQDLPVASHVEPPLNIAENVERARLYERLADVLHAVRAVRIPETDPEELSAVKIVAEADTQELRTVPSFRRAPDQESSDRIRAELKQRALDREEENKRDRRMRQRIQEAKRRLDR